MKESVWSVSAQFGVLLTRRSSVVSSRRAPGIFITLPDLFWWWQLDYSRRARAIGKGNENLLLDSLDIRIRRWN